MHRSIYECDNCKKEIGDKAHISLLLRGGTVDPLSSASGIAIPPVNNVRPKDILNGSSHWRVEKLKSNFLHFCTGRCIGAYFIKELKSHGKAKG